MGAIPYYVVPVLVFAVLLVLFLGGRNLVFSYINQLYGSKQYEELVDFLDTWIAKLFYPSYNRTYAKLNSYLAMGDAEHAGRAFDELLTTKTSSEQRKDLVTKAFEFYMNTDRYKDAKALLPEIATMGDDALSKRCELTYDIVARKSHSHIAEMEAELEGDATSARRIELSYLLSLQYRNKGDEKAADKWHKAAEELLGMPIK